MGNIDMTVLTSDDTTKFDEITADLTFATEVSIHREPGKIIVDTAIGIPNGEIADLSEKNPDITFLAEYSFMSELYDSIHKVQYKAGKSELIEILPCYWAPGSSAIKEKVPCFDELLEKVKIIFERLDVVVDDPEAGKSIDWCDDEVRVSIEHNNYRMKATKRHSFIEDIECFMARETKNMEWEKIAA